MEGVVVVVDEAKYSLGNAIFVSIVLLSCSLVFLLYNFV